MAGNGPVIVGSIVDACNAREQYEGAIGFLLAPLVTRGGGKRSWHVLKVKSDEDGDVMVGWARENEANTKLPTLDLDASELPELPPSKINLWELVYVDTNGDNLAPRIWIDPSARPAQSPRNAPQTAPEAAPRPAQPTTASPPADVFIEALKLQMEATKQANAQNQALLGTVTSSIKEISNGHKEVQQLLQDELKRAHAGAAKAEELRDAALGANTALQNQLAQARESSQAWLTLQALYKDKPELLQEGIRDIIGGVLGAFRSAAND